MENEKWRYASLNDLNHENFIHSLKGDLYEPPTITGK
jgi:hypothetical protein